jgi:dTMP kinase
MGIRGKYVVIEGHDGTGKSTQVGRLREQLTARGIQSIEFHEPEGAPIADEIRTIIKNGKLPRDAETNLLLFTAARHEIWKNARKELERGTWVIAARNYFSTLAYQGYGEGVSLPLITDTTRTFTDETYMIPNLAVILSLDDEIERDKRIKQRGELTAPDTFESKDAAFQQAVKDAYLKIAKEYNLPVISASQTPEIITKQLCELLQLPAST